MDEQDNAPVLRDHMTAVIDMTSSLESILEINPYDLIEQFSKLHARKAMHK